MTNPKSTYGTIPEEEAVVTDPPSQDDDGSAEATSTSNNTINPLLQLSSDSNLLQPLSPQTQQAAPPPHRRGLSEFSFLTSSFRKNTNRRGQHHHRRQSSIAQLVGTLGTGLGTIVEGVQDNVSTAVQEQLQEIDDGRAFFLESGMTRSLGMSPADLPDFLYESTQSLRGLLFLDDDDDDDTNDSTDEDNDDEEHQIVPNKLGHKQLAPKDTTTTKPGIGAYVGLLAAVAAISSNSTALSLEREVAPAMKLFWRLSAVAIVLGAFLLRQCTFQKDGFAAVKEQLQQLSPSQWTTFGFAIICFAFQSLCFNIALDYTSIGNVVIFANSQAVLLLVGKGLSGAPVLMLEGLGAIVASGGAILCATSEAQEDEGDATSAAFEMTLIGQGLAMSSALLGVGYLTFAKVVRTQMTNVTLFTFIVMVACSFLVLVYIMITMGEVVTLNNHPYTGLFGWANWRWDRLGIEVWIVLVCNLIGTMGFVRSMAYFDPILIAVATLLEPMIASMIAVVMDVGLWPTPMGWLGNALVIVGTLAVVAPSAMKGESGGH